MSRGNIAIWFDPATQWYAPSKGKQGRNQTYSDAAIQCCLMIKSLFRLSLRIEPYRVCRRVNILRDYPDDKIKIYP